MKAVLQWVLRTMMKDQTGVMRTLPKKDLVDFNVAMTAERLARNGIDPNSLKNANQVENAINQIEAPRNVQQGIKSTKSAKIMDMEGKEIDPRSKIMGGKQSETEAEILSRIEKENQEAVERIRQKRDMEDPEDMAQGGRAGFDDGGAPSIKYDFDKEKKPMGPTFETNDPEEALKEIVKRMINVEPAKVPLSKDMMLMFDLDRAKIGGQKDISGGELSFGINKGFGRNDAGIGINFRKQFASGGITALKALLNFFAKQRGTKGSQQLKEINPKSVPSGIMNIMGPEHLKMLQKNQTEYLESLLNIIKSDKKFLDQNKKLAETMMKDAPEGFEDQAQGIVKMMIEGSMGKGGRLDRLKVYDKIDIDDAIVDVEQMIKNRRVKESDGRVLNASGGLQAMLGE